MKLINKYLQVDRYYSIQQGDLYFLKESDRQYQYKTLPYPIFQNDLVKNGNETIMTFIGHYCEGDQLYFSKQYEINTYVISKGQAKLFVEGYQLREKVGSYYFGYKGEYPLYIPVLLDENLELIKEIHLSNKTIFYKCEKIYITVHYDGNHIYDSNKYSDKHLKIIECFDYDDNLLWTYTADHLGFFETKESKEVWEIHSVTGENYWTGRYESVSKQNPVLFAHGEKTLVVGDIMLLGTNNFWIIAIDITTGKELYIIKSIEEANYSHPMQSPTEALAKNQPWIGSLGYHKKDDVVYSFMRNTYLEIDYRTGKLLMIDNRATEFTLLHKLNQGRFSEPAYWRVDDIIYYISDMDLEGDKKRSTAYLTAYNVKTREIVFEYPLGKSWKEKLALHAFKKFQLIGNRFYILDHNNTLWVFEDDEFYNRHPAMREDYS